MPGTVAPRFALLKQLAPETDEIPCVFNHAADGVESLCNKVADVFADGTAHDLLRAPDVGWLEVLVQGAHGHRWVIPVAGEVRPRIRGTPHVCSALVVAFADGLLLVALAAAFEAAPTDVSVSRANLNRVHGARHAPDTGSNLGFDAVFGQNTVVHTRKGKLARETSVESSLAHGNGCVVRAWRARGCDGANLLAVDVERVLLAGREGGGDVRPRVQRCVCALEIPDAGAGGAVDLGEDAAVWVDPQAKVAVVGAALAEDAGPVADALGWVGPDGDGEVFGELEVAAAWLADCTRGLRPCDGAGVHVHGSVAERRAGEPRRALAVGIAGLEHPGLKAALIQRVAGCALLAGVLAVTGAVPRWLAAGCPWMSGAVFCSGETSGAGEALGVQGFAAHRCRRCGKLSLDLRRTHGKRRHTCLGE